MADLNKVFLMGRLTFDPELRYTPSGSAVTDLRLATSRAWTGKDGDRKEETLFIDVTVWERQAENCCQYLKKGSSVHVEGSLKMETWDDKNTGEKRSKVKVLADRVQFLDRRGDSGPGDSGDYAPARESAPRRASGPAGEPRAASNGPGRASYPSASSPASRRVDVDPDGESGEDIPF
jgi:single-strand DNA-binding protein